LSAHYDANHPYPATHDDFFSNAMSDLRVAKEFCQRYLPSDLLNVLDLDAIEICKDKHHTINLKTKMTDMLYRVPLKGFAQSAYIAALVEHQSSPKKHMPLRVLCYEAAIMRQHWKRFGVVPLVYTVVFYNGKPRWHYSRDLKDLIQAPPDLIARYALQPFQLVELNQIPDQELRHSLWAGVMSLAMKHIYDRDIIPALSSFIDMLKRIEHEHAGDDFIISLLYYLHERGAIRDEDQFHELIAMQLPLESGEKIMTLGQLNRQRGRYEERMRIARKLLHSKMKPEDIIALTDLTEKELINLETQICDES
jgi:recombination-promoting nuclease RpnB